ncbi:MAG: antibiotic biosynthesis monooxygenase [Bacteroidia bacterium]|nr:antibiotic biosynthesis monooxygenase [Bacteroidia bacterium]
MNIANTPETPYYAVIFTSVLSSATVEYTKMAEEMEQLAKTQSGYLGMESARNELGITVSYWETEEAITQWKQNARHLFAQQRGKEEWYKHYHVRVCKVERAYSF